jgi:NAD-dependent deacetylase
VIEGKGNCRVELDAIKRLVEESDNIVFFGGAGVSTESGIPDFRSADGLFVTERNREVAPEEILSHDFFMRHPGEFYQFYFTKLIFKDAKPNAAHRALAELERRGKLKAVITQNIDGLHQMAGSRNVLELHGSLHRNYCMSCRKTYDLAYVLGHEPGVPHCEQCGGVVRPDVVLYQETLDDDVLSRSIRHISEADVFIVGGTSLQVYPAAGLVQYYRGGKMILINKSPTPFDSLANFVISDSIGRVMDILVS